MVRDPKIEDVIKHAMPTPTKTGEALIQAAYEGGGEDNVSVIVVQITEAWEPGWAASLQLLAKPDTVQMPNFYFLILLNAEYLNCRTFLPVL